MKVIGIDPSMTATGYALLDNTTYTHSPIGGDARLWLISRNLRGILNEEQVDLAVIEDLPANAKSAGITGMVQGVIRLGLMDANVPYVAVSPASLKMFATGRGNATKADMRMSLYQRTGHDMRDDNQVDAWWLRQMGLAVYNESIDLPKTHLRALDKVDWSPAPNGEPE